jgi:hypothetical protein
MVPEANLYRLDWKGLPVGKHSSLFGQFVSCKDNKMLRMRPQLISNKLAAFFKTAFLFICVAATELIFSFHGCSNKQQ